VLMGNSLLFTFTLFFLLRDGDRLLRQWNELLPFPEELKKRIHRPAIKISFFWFVLSLLGGVQCFGLLGIVLGPMIFVILAILLDAYRITLNLSDD
jgi:predicted PurR-regulated permease PerM